ncbi:MAG: CaiB/BaiF CoA-transferase family protein [Hyphomicrobiaceae bacterium]
MAGPLSGLRVVQVAGLGPVPFAATMLSDMGADVVRIDRPGTRPLSPWEITGRGRRAVEIDLKTHDGTAAAMALAEVADILLEGFRPGVMERLGLGPDVLLALNPRLVYGRMTGWGQSGPRAGEPGHDVNYIALSGVLHAIGSPGGPPVPPLNLIGDYGGGALYLVAGVLAALHERQMSGCGQVVDCAMLDGAASLMAEIVDLANTGQWSMARGSNLLDGGAHFYGVYECKDGRHIAIAPMERQFYVAFCERVGVDLPDPDSYERSELWAEARTRLANHFKTRTRDEWCAYFAGTEACVVPVLTMDESPGDPQVAAREIYVTYDGVRQPAPAPRFSRTPAQIQSPPPSNATPVEEVLSTWRSRPVGAGMREGGAS